MAKRQISPARRFVYYFGVALTVIGLLTFFSVLVTGALRFGDVEGDYTRRVRGEGIRALAGAGMVFVGGFLLVVGRAGLAGSGVSLDPEQAREDAEPWSRATGGMQSDALDEAGIELGQRSADEQLPLDERLRRLHKLHQDGLLNQHEYESKKQQLLAEK